MVKSWIRKYFINKNQLFLVQDTEQNCNNVTKMSPPHLLTVLSHNCWNSQQASVIKLLNSLVWNLGNEQSHVRSMRICNNKSQARIVLSSLQTVKCLVIGKMEWRVEGFRRVKREKFPEERLAVHTQLWCSASFNITPLHLNNKEQLRITLTAVICRWLGSLLRSFH